MAQHADERAEFEQMRESFEAEIIKANPLARTTGCLVTLGNHYIDPDCEGRWDIWKRAWQAARRAPVVPVPQWGGKIDAADFTVDTFRRRGSGWLIKPDNCVRITHVPTGLFEEETSQRSVHGNKAVAWERLCARLEALAAAHGNDET